MSVVYCGCGHAAPSFASTCPSCGRPLGTPEASAPAGRVGFGAFAVAGTGAGEAATVPAAGQLPWAPIDLRKLIVMSIGTLGLYELYWFYDNWRRVKNETGEKISPVWRAIFAPIWCFALFNKVQQSASREDVPVTWQPVAQGLIYLSSVLVALMPLPLGLVGLAGLIAIATVHRTTQQINARHAGRTAAEPNDKYSPLNIAGLVVGALIYIANLFPWLLPW